MIRTSLLAVLIFFLEVSFAHAEKRVALVIGNSAYEHAGKLENPKNDATDVAAVLRTLGVQVIEGLDLDKASFDRKIREFAEKLQGAEAGVFFFAGHGLQVGGHNYLVPIDAELKTASALDFEMVRADVVQRVMENETTTNILFLDACRDNPLARNLARSMGTRSVEIGRGLAPVVSGVGTLISFSTQPGNVALDGRGRNSPFASALVKYVSTSGDDLSALLIDVRNDVIRETQSKQVPWEHSALRGRFYFNPGAQVPLPRPMASPQLGKVGDAQASRDYELAAKIGTKTAWDAFIAKHADGFYTDLARAHLSKLDNTAVAPAAAPASANPSVNKVAPKEPPPKQVKACDVFQVCMRVVARLEREGQNGPATLGADYVQQYCRTAVSHPAAWCGAANQKYSKGQ